ncbi:hypothetical protein VOLCADRAFT_89570 [Volvox carteri f. nagariensis]|uniref:Uncharacterized protein n=1 Tax=Volvox carteri f. nagariensis TaxID=3068 RepID=D8TS68_VOLCA|nr:uncharacterized protein VOLCADRAFT_89570 [Volvox carteri f. nagariensis]EFJ49772.1 hypothetical protein VOLCADRAFT_89570 [Volvox carteri f. nagariensis]|eukprot:XP_002949279.1 hypothetical protein VOLCADRAFT_89570 [Volvox carteri f. nagariensis]
MKRGKIAMLPHELCTGSRGNVATRPHFGVFELALGRARAAEWRTKPLVSGLTCTHSSQERLLAGEWRQQQQALVPELVLLCATYAPPRLPALAPAAAAMAADPGLPPPPGKLYTPRPTGAAAAAAESLLPALHRRVRPQPPPSRALCGPAAACASAGAASLALLPAEVVSEQDTLTACLPELLHARIRPIVVQRHVQSLEEGPIRPYTGPGVAQYGVTCNGNSNGNGSAAGVKRFKLLWQ